MHEVFLYDGTLLSLAQNPIASGGEAKVYDVISQLNGKKAVAKIFTVTPSDNKLKKLDFLINHFKWNGAETALKKSVVLPSAFLYDRQKQVCGYLMPKVSDKIPLRHVMLNYYPSDAQYDRLKLLPTNSVAVQNRLIIALNIVKVLRVCHDNHLVVFDLKPDNILVSYDGSLNFIDMDGAQFYDTRTFSPADVATPEYSPPEIPSSSTPVQVQWDLYILGLMLYQLLFEIHPFMATHPDGLTQEELKSKGCFVHGRQRAVFTHISPKHDDFYKLPITLQRLFIRCLDEGSFEPRKRPDLSEWEKALSGTIANQQANIYSWDYVPQANTQQTRSQTRKKQRPIVKKPIIDLTATVQNGRTKVKWHLTYTVSAKLHIFHKKNGVYLLHSTQNISLSGSLDLPLTDARYEIEAHGNHQKKTICAEEITVPSPIIKMKTSQHSDCVAFWWRIDNASTAELNVYRKNAQQQYVVHSRNSIPVNGQINLPCHNALFEITATGLDGTKKTISKIIYTSPLPKVTLDTTQDQNSMYFQWNVAFARSVKLRIFKKSEPSHSNRYVLVDTRHLASQGALDPMPRVGYIFEITAESLDGKTAVEEITYDPGNIKKSEQGIKKNYQGRKAVSKHRKLSRIRKSTSMIRKLAVRHYKKCYGCDLIQRIQRIFENMTPSNKSRSLS